MSTKRNASKAPSKKPAAQSPPAKKAAAKKSPAKPVKKAAPTTKAKASKTMEPRPKATHPPTEDAGIFGMIQKNIQEGISVITGTILPDPKRSSRKR